MRESPRYETAERLGLAPRSGFVQPFGQADALRPAASARGLPQTLAFTQSPPVSIDATRFQTALSSLHAAERDERVRALQAAVLQHTQDMNARGLLFSSICVNGVGDLCRAALADLAAKLWDSLLRVHSSAPDTSNPTVRSTFVQLQ